MLEGAAFVILGLLPTYATGQLMTTDAKCLPGYEWTFNTLKQSPCDVAASLAAVCSPNGQFDLDPLPSGYVYAGPPTEFANSCRCSSVYYSMLSACGYCQGRSFKNWSEYRTNCSTVSLQTYNQPLPSGVNVPAWAYLNVLDGNNLNITLAQRTRGTESSRLPPSPTTSSSSLAILTGSRTNVGAIAGGVAGGVVVLIIIALVTILLLRKRRTTRRTTTSTNSQSPLPARSNMTSPNLFPQTSELNSFDGGVVDSPMWRQQSPLAPSLTSHFSGSSRGDRQALHPQWQSDIPTQYAMAAPQNANAIFTPQNANAIFTPQNANAIFTPHNTNTMAPTRMHSTQSLSHQIPNTALPALGQNTSQNVISALPKPNQNSISTQNLRQSVASISNEQSPTQDVISTPPKKKLWQNTIPAQDIPPPQYTVEPY